MFKKKEPTNRIFNKNQKWIKQFMLFGILTLSFWILAIILNFTLNIVNSNYIYYPLRVSNTILVFWIGYQGLFHYRLINNRISLRIEIEETGFNRGNLYLNQEKAISNHALSKKFEELNKYIIKKESFLNPSFSIADLSNENNLSISHVSNIINTCNRFNFSDYINQLRVEYAKQLLKNKEYNQYTVIAIGLESGFNSKSTFYTAFKKFVYKTPTQYRNQNNS